MTGGVATVSAAGCDCAPFVRAAAMPVEAAGLLSHAPARRWCDSVLGAADRYRHVLLAATGLLYLLAFNGQWLIEPDSALYLTLARNIARGDGYVYHGLAHNVVYPGLPYSLAALFRLIPSQAIVGCDLLILICGWAALALTYRLMLLAYDRPTAVVVTVLTGLAHEYFRYCYEIMPEMPFLAGVMAVLAGHEALTLADRPARWWDWAIFAAGVVIVINTRPMMMPLLGLWVVATAWNSGRLRRGVATPVVLGVVALMLIFFWYEPRHPFTTTTVSYERIAVREIVHLPGRWRQVLTNLKDLLGKSAVRAVLGTPLEYPLLSGLFSAAILGAGIALGRVRPLWGMWVAATVAKLALFYSHDRYLVPVLPLLMFGWWRFMCRVSIRLPGLWGNGVFAILLAATVVPNIAETGVIVVQQHLQPFITHYRDGRLAGMAAMAGELDRRTGAGDLILAPPETSRALTFLSDRIVLEPGDPIAPAAGERVFVLIGDRTTTVAMEEWLARWHVVRCGEPLVSLPGNAVGLGAMSLCDGRVDSK